jgi:hypothetical protein
MGVFLIKEDGFSTSESSSEGGKDVGFRLVEHMMKLP